MDAGIANIPFWGALSVALVIAGVFAFPANRWLIARGKGHTAIHQTGIHGGPPVKVVGAIAAIAAIFGTAVLINEAIADDGMGERHDQGHAAMRYERSAEHSARRARHAAASRR